MTPTQPQSLGHSHYRILSTATAAYGIEGVSGSGDITKTGTYGTLSLNTATGVYSYALDLSDTETAALSGGDVVNETFTVTVSDGLGGSASATLTIPIQGSGINLDAVTGDDLINLAEATAGLNLTGKTNPGQTISVVLSSSGTLAGTNSTTSGSDGTFSIPITAADITAMGEGSETFTVSMDYPKTHNIKVTVDSRCSNLTGKLLPLILLLMKVIHTSSINLTRVIWDIPCLVWLVRQFRG